MGNILRCLISCFDGEDQGISGGNGRADHFPNYSYSSPSSRLLYYYQPLRSADHQLPLSPPPPRPRRQRQQPPLGYRHGVRVEKTSAQCRDFLKLEFTSTVSAGPRHNDTSYRKTHPNRDEKDNHVFVPVLTCGTNLSPLASHGASSLERDLVNLAATSRVPEGLARHVTSSSKVEQVTWYVKILAAYKNTKCPPRSSTDAATLVATALRGIQQTNLEGVLAFYGFPIPPTPKEASETTHPPSIPKGVLFVLKTLPVNAKRIVDGDGFTAYVDTAIPIEVCEDLDAGGQDPNSRRQKRKQERADDLQTSLQNAGHKQIFYGGREIVARQYEIRLRGIDAPEMGMQYGKESQDALVKLIAWKCVTLHVYGQDQFNRFVCDIYCDNVFVQEQMLVNGHAWHFMTYDKRPQFAKWEKMAQDARRGLWAYDNPEKPWDWRKKKRNASKHQQLSSVLTKLNTDDLKLHI
ncbi:probable staphylococcal-like nuclease CAN4 isoform X2 [Oryza brachyantha]|uniref:probable staphylococcal-like nuclease CAN4 isoform X2 n=1 Tax=Oryza brachyantha TaxID=4533 RepID=UPI0007765979|nr:probable staphylococcal-like nuclease CAN4 isoform X2 [Oryza brachyantha]